MNQNENTLYNILLGKTVEELKVCEILFGVDVKSTARKAERALTLANVLTSNPESTLSSLPLCELYALRALSRKGEGKSIQLHWTDTAPLTFHAGITSVSFDRKAPGSFTLSFPSGVRGIYAPYISKVIKEIENSPRKEYESFFWGVLTLYGKVSHSELTELIYDNYSDGDNEDEVYDYLDFLRNYPIRILFIKEGGFCHPATFEFDRTLTELRKERGSDKLSPKTFTKQQIIAAGSDMPYSSAWRIFPEGRHMHDMLENYLGIKGKPLEYAMYELYMEKQNKGSCTEMMKAAIETIAPDSASAVNDVATTFMEYSNAAPYWVFKGRSSSEVGGFTPVQHATAQSLASRLEQISQEASVYPKVGRNDPCPCGSGLKYKNCHGKGQS